MESQQIQVKVIFLVSTYDKISSEILSSTVESSPFEELSGITIDGELTFHNIIMLRS